MPDSPAAVRPRSWLSRAGRALNRQARRGLLAVLGFIWPIKPNGELPPPGQVRRVLLVRVNFRMGNTILGTALLAMLQARFPGAEIDILAAEGPAVLLGGLPFGRVFLVSRRHAWKPWQFLGLFRELRRQRYDVAIDGGLSSFSGALYAWLAGARVRVGAAGKADQLLTVRLPRIEAANLYDVQPALARQLGVEGLAAGPVYRVSTEEAQAADLQLRGLLPPGARAENGFIAVFVGGHARKRWPRENWLRLCERLAESPVPVLVFVGPEEVDFLAELGRCAGGAGRVVPPQPLRRFAALLARARLLVTPDSGPLHLGAALGLPLVAVIQTEGSRNFVPPGPEHRIVFQPSGAELADLVRAHPAFGRAATAPVG